jgi:ADP-heptose:LPS heptosyltransferase
VPDRIRDILVIDLLGGLGDLVMVLPVVHALARRNPGARLRLLTHAPGDALVRTDPAVTEVHRAPPGAERAAVRAELDRRRPDLVVSTTRHSDIPAEIAGRGLRGVTDLWRGPPPDQPVTSRYLHILATEGLIDEVDARTARPRIHLTPAEHRDGDTALAAQVAAGPPVVLIPGAGMAVKRWPHWAELAAALAARGRAALVVTEPGRTTAALGPARPLPASDLRGLAALFAAVGRRGGTVVGPDTGPLRVAAAVGARTVGLFGPTSAARYGLSPPEPGLPVAFDLQGLPDCPHRRPTAITEQVCWWQARCPLSPAGPACMADLGPGTVLDAVDRLGRPRAHGAQGHG